MSLELVLFLNLVAISTLMFAIWIISLRLQNASIIDIAWGMTFCVVGWASAIACGGWRIRDIVILSIVSIWGIRLSTYLAGRNLGKPEDYRYAAMRKHHGKRFPIVSLLTVFALQGLLAWVISLPIQVGIHATSGWHLGTWAGVALWSAGLFFESVGDWQLARFKQDANNRGQVMNRGLWRYTRHPNYFGDSLVWWGIYLVCVEPNTWWWTVLGPLLMTILLIRVSGVRLLERSLRTRLAGYDEYVNRTSSFIPLPPRKSRRGA